MVLHVMPAWLWYTAFLYCYSSTITTPFPSPFVATIYKPSLLYLGFLTLPFSRSPFSLFPLRQLPPTSTHSSYNMPIQLLYTALHYIHLLYRLRYPRRRQAYTPATHDTIVIVSSCYIVATLASLHFFQPFMLLPLPPSLPSSSLHLALPSTPPSFFLHSLSVCFPEDVDDDAFLDVHTNSLSQFAKRRSVLFIGHFLQCITATPRRSKLEWMQQFSLT